MQLENKSSVVVMYHYVRPSNLFLNRGIRALELNKFNAQLEYLQFHYEICNLEQYFEGGLPKSRKPKCLLTFDDGYLDHYQFVYPSLKNRNLSGLFFIPTGILDQQKNIFIVNLLHLLFECAGSEEDLFNYLLDYAQEFGKSRDEFSHELMQNCKEVRYRSSIMNAIKVHFQECRNKDLARAVLISLIKKYCQFSEKLMHESMYLSESNLVEMLSNNMEIGSHGHTHTTFDNISFEEQKNEIELSLQYLNGIKKTGTVESISYPYGRYNHQTIEILGNCSVKYGFKANEAEYPISRLEIPRLDTIYINHDKY